MPEDQTPPDHEADFLAALDGHSVPTEAAEALGFVQAVYSNKTREWLDAKGALPAAGAKVTPQQIIAIAKAVCAIGQPVCQFVDQLPS